MNEQTFIFNIMQMPADSSQEKIKPYISDMLKPLGST